MIFWLNWCIINQFKLNQEQCDDRNEETVIVPTSMKTLEFNYDNA